MTTALIGFAALLGLCFFGFRIGYANGQVFVFDDGLNGWQGFEIIIPAPARMPDHTG